MADQKTAESKFQVRVGERTERYVPREGSGRWVASTSQTSRYFGRAASFSIS